MKQLSVTEFERIPRKRLGSDLCSRLQHFDERFARSSGATVFDWSRIGYVRARNWVGVVQIPGLQIEILPKTDADQGQARKNLLLMMSVCRRLPIRERDIANLLLEKRPILEALIAVFSGRLLNELRRGLDQEYVRREENMGFVRGKIVLPVHLRRNLAHAERVYVVYDEFLADTPVNHILKRTCRVLLRQTRNTTTQRELREAILVMANVTERRSRARFLAPSAEPTERTFSRPSRLLPSGAFRRHSGSTRRRNTHVLPVGAHERSLRRVRRAPYSPTRERAGLRALPRTHPGQADAETSASG